jgi:hypothetical protein
VNTTRLDVLHDTDDVGILTVTNSICLCFDGPIKVMIEQYSVPFKLFEEVYYMTL